MPHVPVTTTSAHVLQHIINYVGSLGFTHEKYILVRSCVLCIHVPYYLAQTTPFPRNVLNELDGGSTLESQGITKRVVVVVEER